ncbi:hypothetical protein Hanom_Chr16g01514551 [Helianthus anomalus]
MLDFCLVPNTVIIERRKIGPKIHFALDLQKGWNGPGQNYKHLFNPHQPKHEKFSFNFMWLLESGVVEI